MKNKLLLASIVVISVASVTAKSIFDKFRRGHKQTNSVYIKVAYPADMKYVFPKLEKLFEQSHSLMEVLPYHGAAGNQLKSLSNSKPFHMFISAGKQHIKYIQKSKNSRGKSRVIANGQLIIYAPNRRLLLSYDNYTYKKYPPSLVLKNILLSPVIKKIVIANPEVSAYGRAAMNTLKKLNVMQFLKGKILVVKNISQVNLYLRNQIADLGFTERSFAFSRRIKGGGRSKVEDKYYSRVNHRFYSNLKHYMIKTKYGNHEQQKVANSFFKFLSSKQARYLLNSYGYK